MKFRLNIRHELKIAAVLVVVFGLIAFTERVKEDAVVRDIRVQVVNSEGNYFVEESDILTLMEVDQRNLIGVNISSLSLKALEEKIKRDPFIRNAELYCDLKGNVTARVELRRPIARMMRNDGPDGYIAEDGTIMPVSERFTSRVMLITGAYVNGLIRKQHVQDDPWGARLKEMIDWIRKDEFWHAQISELNIDRKGRITLLPQVGDEWIEFGHPEDVETKFRKLMIFYKEILPRVGWNKYDRINLEYAGQIVAE